MSLDAAVMDLSNAFEYGQGYVALSRVRSLARPHLLGWNERALRVHPLALEKDADFRRARPKPSAERLAARRSETAAAQVNLPRQKCAACRSRLPKSIHSRGAKRTDRQRL